MWLVIAGLLIATASPPDPRLPSLKLLDSVQTTTNTRQLALHLRITSGTALSQSLHVFINDVAVFNHRGLKVLLAESGEKSVEQTVAVPLQFGRNHVELFVRDDQGQDSAHEVTETTLVGAQPARKRYVLTIGVSKFKDDKFNLSHAALDAADMRTQFSKPAQAFAEVETKTLVDEDVTKENILSLRRWLERAQVDDQLLVFLAGQGVVDQSFDFYFATHDTDFSAPSKRALKYQAIEGLLEGLAVRSKILLVQTCHTANARSFASVETLMRPHFAAFERTTGVRVLALATQSEIVFESDTTSHGVFVHNLLSSLEQLVEDKAGDRRASVNEVFGLVAKRAPLLSRTAQVLAVNKDSVWFDDTLAQR